MKRIWKQLTGQLRYQIIIPFLLLTLVVSVIGASLSFFFLAQSIDERFNNQLASIASSVTDSIVAQERSNLEFLREAAFAPENNDPEVAAPAVAEALATNDRQGLARALHPYFRLARNRSQLRIDRLIAFNQAGETLVDFESFGQASEPTVHAPFLIQGLPYIDDVLTGRADDLGDKYAYIISFDGSETYYLVTIAPVYHNEQIVGGLIAGMRLDSFLTMLRDRSQAAGITAYDTAGRILHSTFVENTDPIDSDFVRGFWNNPDITSEGFSVNKDLQLAPREFKAAYAALFIRSEPLGIIAPALSNEFVMSDWQSAFAPILGLVLVLAVSIIIVGVFIANRITHPLQDLVATSKDVAAGQFNRRATVYRENEIGQLAVSFNQMTEFLTQLYAQVQSEASQRAAIVDSITDGIVVVDDQGDVQLINRATRRLMRLPDDAPAPKKLSDIPLEPLTDGVPGFGTQRAQDLYTLGDFIVRASIAPVVGVDQSRSGYVCVLQDMTSEVAVDRAKTNFIGTISHELKTPLTVIGGNADLLLRGLVGRLEDDQASFVETIRLHANNMAGLLQNVITVAHLDAGVTTTDLEAVELARAVDEANWRVQSQIKAKGLTLTVDIPSDLRPVWADFDHVRQVVFQLVDNARRYTSSGGISVRALDCGDHVRVEVKDTGRGIPPDMHEQIFQRFIRGDGASEGINSAERGIGLGLAICKQLVERLGGTIGVESVPDQGSTFYFTLRYADDTPKPEKSSSMAAAA
ncbi:ATP-binding protein [Candidatus Viridilinea mediisalina]|uniref:histidine kinase n=1 Tax=Candidatus Viridilinea mediisalina TaxID=2024553 RepID=A0A2A6RJG8_9CHLR|nr:ATP-binding protein [Candidatus Viridilinea mediisalina]PDW03152.1 PAS domain-containing sensor histidine kinase [Candidatus Viridilinea mediisalina]